MFGFASKRKAEVLSGYAGQLLAGANSVDEAPPIISPPQLANDLRFRRYFTPAQVIEPIPEAYWDDSISMWRAGVGLVRIYQRYNPLDDQDVTQDPATRMGPWNYDHNDGTQVKSDWRDVLCYNIDPCTLHPITDSDGHPNIVYVSEDVHGDLWVLERPTDAGPSFVMASSSECLLPGSGGLVELYYLDNGVWLPSGLYCDMVDPGCNIMALPGEKFWVNIDRESCHGQVTGCHAVAPHGLIRRVRVFDEIACKASGLATVLYNDGQCSGSPSTCKIMVCNNSNRIVKCDGSLELEYEDGLAFLMQDKCNWILIPDPRATIARATLDGPLCGNAAAIKQGSETFTDVCEWTEKIPVADNPFGHKACDETEIELTWNAKECSWYVSDVARIEDKIVTKFTPCGDGCTALKEVHYSKSAIETCECESESEDILRFTSFDVMTGLTFRLNADGSCSMIGQLYEVCMPACVDFTSKTDEIILNKKKVLNNLTLESDGIHCHSINVFTPCDDGISGDDLCIPTTDCTEEAEAGVTAPYIAPSPESLIEEVIRQIPRDRLVEILRKALES